MDCPYETKEVRDSTIVENDLAFAFLTNIPIVPGHVLVCPKRHVPYYEDTTPEEKIAIEKLTSILRRTLKKVFGAQGFNYAWNEEKIGGQGVPHFHLHIVPRKEGDTGIYKYDPREFLYRPGPRDITPREELSEVTELIRKGI